MKTVDPAMDKQYRWSKLVYVIRGGVFREKTTTHFAVPTKIKKIKMFVMRQPLNKSYTGKGGG